MYGKLYVSRLVGSDAMANPLPATSAATTWTHNQPQPQLPSGTVAMAALQNDRDDLHLAGNEACRCSLCRITDRFFPQSQDGRIVLPHPIMSVHSHSTGLQRLYTSGIFSLTNTQKKTDWQHCFKPWSWVGRQVSWILISCILWLNLSSFIGSKTQWRDCSPSESFANAPSAGVVTSKE